MSWTDKARISAAAQAIREIRNNTTIGLGSGNTILRALELAAERIKKENLKIGDLNKMLNDAKAAHDANNDAQAVAVMQQAAQAGPNLLPSPSR